MRAMAYDQTGEVREVTVPLPEPDHGEVRVRIGVSGVNPADWRNRRRYADTALVVPNHDGAGVVDAVGSGVDPARIGERVWLWETGLQRCGGTAQEFTIVPDGNAVQLPDGVSLDHGACLGVPAVTAHRCLTVAEGGPQQLGPGTLTGRIVLVAGGAGAVGHAAIQLARWSGAEVITTVSTDEKAMLAEAAGANHIVKYRQGDATEAIRAVAPEGVDIVVELAPDQNTELDLGVLAPDGVVSVYAAGAMSFVMEVGRPMGLNARWQFVSIFTMPAEAKRAATRAIEAALLDGVLPVGAEAGLPLHRFPLVQTQEAHEAVEQGAIGKVLIEVAGLD